MDTRTTTHAALALALLLLAPAAFAATPAFTPLGDLPGGDYYSIANGISADGAAIVGMSKSASGSEAFLYTADGAMLPLGDLPTGPFGSRAANISPDGATVVGHGTSEAALFQYDEAFYWTAATGLQPCGVTGTQGYSTAHAASLNGDVLVGSAGYLENNAMVRQAFRWTSDQGLQLMGDLPGGAFESQAFDIAADASVIVGQGSSDSGPEAFRWTALDGFQPLGDLPGGDFWSLARAVSHDGETIVGYSRSQNNAFEAFRWSAAQGMQPLGDLLLQLRLRRLRKRALHRRLQRVRPRPRSIPLGPGPRHAQPQGPPRQRLRPRPRRLDPHLRHRHLRRRPHHRRLWQ